MAEREKTVEVKSEQIRLMKLNILITRLQLAMVFNDQAERWRTG